jgi:glutaminyl-peptide cyclotransferase
MRLLFTLLAFVFITACNNDPKTEEKSTVATIQPPTQLSYSLLKVYPHDTSAYTQGLQYAGGFLYEGTGNPGRVANISKLRKVEFTTGKILKETFIPGELFGEGITILGNKIYQLTWKDKKGFIYNFSDFKLIKEFSYDLEQGWGLTNDGTNLIVTDGSSNIYFWDPETLKEIKRISVQDDKGLKNNLNELEYINGYIYANVYETTDILKIDPATGNVIGRIDFSALQKSYPELESPPSDVLNGIAWDSSGNRLFITGKYWSKLFEIKLN